MATFAPDDRPPLDPASAEDENRHLRRALISRPVIDQAKGVLIAQHGCTPDQAFAMLAEASQRLNRKLRDIAEGIVTGTVGSASISAGDATGGASESKRTKRDLAADTRDEAADARDPGREPA
jgi:hypothetical protein